MLCVLQDQAYLKMQQLPRLYHASAGKGKKNASGLKAERFRENGTGGLPEEALFLERFREKAFTNQESVI